MDTETKTLLAFLDAQRNHVLGILADLDEQALRQIVLPSGWNCVGLVQHLALDDERFWFQAVVAGDNSVIDELATASDAWQVGPDVPAEDVLARYRREIEVANEIIARTPLDKPPAFWPDFFGEWRLASVREIVLHVITETACHAGHLDAARELMDGRQWMVN